MRRLALSCLAYVVIAIGLLPAWNLHIVPEEARSRFKFMYSHPGFRSEYERWEDQSRGPLRGREVGLALKEHSKPGDSLVIGAVGAVGYYSELFIYDRFGLVTREVALLPRGDPGLRSPGHEFKVSRSFFVDRHPTYLMFIDAGAKNVRDRVLLEAEAWRQYIGELTRRYVPDFIVLDDQKVSEAKRLLLVLKAIEEAPDDPVRDLPRPRRRRERRRRAQKAWNDSYGRVESLPTGNET